LSLSGNPLQYTDTLIRRDDPVQTETRRAEQRSELPFGPLPSAGNDEHLQIQQFCNRGFVSRGHDHLNNQKFRTRPHGSAAFLQDALCLLLRPVVKDVGQEVGIAACRDRFKKIAFHDGTAILDSSLLDGFSSPGDYRSKVGYNPLQ